MNDPKNTLPDSKGKQAPLDSIPGKLGLPAEETNQEATGKTGAADREVSNSVNDETVEIIALRLIFDKPGAVGVPPGHSLRCGPEIAAQLIKEGLACSLDDIKSGKVARPATWRADPKTFGCAPGLANVKHNHAIFPL